MAGNGADEYTACQVPRRDEPSLSKTSRGPHIDPIIAQRGYVEQESYRLLHIGEEEVVDEKKELVWGVAGAFCEPPRNETPGQEEEQRCRTEEGEEAECGDCDQAMGKNVRQWCQRLRIDIKHHRDKLALTENERDICKMESEAATRRVCRYMELRLHVAVVTALRCANGQRVRLRTAGVQGFARDTTSWNMVEVFSDDGSFDAPGNPRYAGC